MYLAGAIEESLRAEGWTQDPTNPDVWHRPGAGTKPVTEGEQ